MKKIFKIGIISVFVLLLVVVLRFFVLKNSSENIIYKSQTPFVATIENATLATGSIIPKVEVAVKPQISGIIDKIYVQEGQRVQQGDLIAKIEVVPNEQTLSNAKGQVRTAKMNLEATKIEYDSNKKLFENAVIPLQDFNKVRLKYKNAKQNLKIAQNQYKIIKEGSAEKSGAANTYIRSTISGTILEIPIKQGDQVIQSNNFNAGTTITSIANLNQMIFEGKIEEADVNYLKKDSPLEITVGAIKDQKFKGKLYFIAPKGTSEGGVIMFKVKAQVTLKDSLYLRAGYSANAKLVLQKVENVLSIKEALVQYDAQNQKPFVEIEQTPQKFKKVYLTLGLSDGVNVQVLEGLKKSDKIKVTE